MFRGGSLPLNFGALSRVFISFLFPTLSAEMVDEGKDFPHETSRQFFLNPRPVIDLAPRAVPD